MVSRQFQRHEFLESFHAGALAIINHFKPTRPLAGGVTLDELYPEGFHERDLALPRDPQRFTLRIFFSGSTASTNGSNGAGCGRPQAGPAQGGDLDARTLRSSDGLAAIFPAMLNSLIALKALGYPDHHPK